MKAVIYARQSKDRTGDAAAVERQLAECRVLAASNGWDVARELVDNDRSATRGERPAWRELLADADAGRYDVLVTWHPDRLYRRLRDLVDLLTVAERRALRIAAVKAGDLDLSTPAGRMVASLVGSVAEYEVAHKGQRQRAANTQRARNGHVGWSLRPYGYDKVDGKIVVVEDEAAILREVADRVLGGEPMRTIVADLNARGVPTLTGTAWSTTPLRRMLISPRTAGRAVLKGHDYGRADHPAILDEETHGRLVALFRDPSRTRDTAPTVKHLLSGLLVCGKCGASMFYAPARKGHSRAVYRCTESAHLSRSQAPLDEFISAVVVERLSRPDALSLLVPDVDVDALRAQAVELRDRRDGLAEMLAEGLVGRDAAREQARKLTDRITGVEASINSATGATPAVEVAASPDPDGAWRTMDLMNKRSIISTLMVITVLPTAPGRRPFNPNSIDISWRS